MAALLSRQAQYDRWSRPRCIRRRGADLRAVQELRKASGLRVEDRIRLWYDGTHEWRRAFERFGSTISGETLAVELSAGRPPAGVELDGESQGGDLWIGLKRV